MTTVVSTRPPLKPDDITTEDVMPEGLPKLAPFCNLLWMIIC